LLALSIGQAYGNPDNHSLHVQYQSLEPETTSSATIERVLVEVSNYGTEQVNNLVLNIAQPVNALIGKGDIQVGDIPASGSTVLETDLLLPPPDQIIDESILWQITFDDATGTKQSALVSGDKINP